MKNGKDDDHESESSGSTKGMATTLVYPQREVLHCARHRTAEEIQERWQDVIAYIQMQSFSSIEELEDRLLELLVNRMQLQASEEGVVRAAMRKMIDDMPEIRSRLQRFVRP